MKNLAIVTPGFSADCLETLEEIAVENAEIFQAQGGENFAAIPCLNDSEAGMAVISHVVLRELFRLMDLLRSLRCKIGIVDCRPLAGSLEPSGDVTDRLTASRWPERPPCRGSEGPDILAFRALKGPVANHNSLNPVNHRPPGNEGACRLSLVLKRAGERRRDALCHEGRLCRAVVISILLSRSRRWRWRSRTFRERGGPRAIYRTSPFKPSTTIRETCSGSLIRKSVLKCFRTRAQTSPRTRADTNTAPNGA